MSSNEPKGKGRQKRIKGIKESDTHLYFDYTLNEDGESLNEFYKTTFQKFKSETSQYTIHQEIPKKLQENLENVAILLDIQKFKNLDFILRDFKCSVSSTRRQRKLKNFVYLDGEVKNQGLSSRVVKEMGENKTHYTFKQKKNSFVLVHFYKNKEENEDNATDQQQKPLADSKSLNSNEKNSNYQEINERSNIYLDQNKSQQIPKKCEGNKIGGQQKLRNTFERQKKNLQFNQNFPDDSLLSKYSDTKSILDVNQLSRYQFSKPKLNRIQKMSSSSPFIKSSSQQKFDNQNMAKMESEEQEFSDQILPRNESEINDEQMNHNEDRSNNNNKQFYQQQQQQPKFKKDIDYQKIKQEVQESFFEQDQETQKQILTDQYNKILESERRKSRFWEIQYEKEAILRHQLQLQLLRNEEFNHEDNIINNTIDNPFILDD